VLERGGGRTIVEQVDETVVECVIPPHDDPRAD